MGLTTCYHYYYYYGILVTGLALSLALAYKRHALPYSSLFSLSWIRHFHVTLLLSPFNSHESTPLVGMAGARESNRSFHSFMGNSKIFMTDLIENNARLTGLADSPLFCLRSFTSNPLTDSDSLRATPLPLYYSSLVLTKLKKMSSLSIIFP